MNAFRKLKIASMSIALLLTINGCSSNAVPTISPVKADASTQVQTPTAPAPVVAPIPTPAATVSTAPSSTPAAPPVVTPTPAPKQAPQVVTVYITKTGKKYHSNGCRYLSQSKIPISLSDAKSGYGPCSVCNPPL